MSTLRTLTVRIADDFESLTTFQVNVGKRSPKTCSLHHFPTLRKIDIDSGCRNWEILSIGTVMKSVYSEADIAERTRFDAETPLNDGDTVVVDGAKFVLKVRGDFSNAAYLLPVTE